MTDLTVFHVPGSRSMRSVWLLHELGVAFTVKELPFDLKVLRAPEYLAVSPLGRVPAIQHGELKLIESGAIAQYLTWRFPEKNLGRAPGDPEWPQWVQWIHFAETIAVHGASQVQQQVFIRPEDRSPVVKDLESKRLVKCYEVIDRALGEQDFLLPGGFSAADVGVGYSLHLGRGFTPMPEHLIRVRSYYDRLAARRAFQAATESERRRQS